MCVCVSDIHSLFSICFLTSLLSSSGGRGQEIPPHLPKRSLDNIVTSKSMPVPPSSGKGSGSGISKSSGSGSGIGNSRFAPPPPSYVPSVPAGEQSRRGFVLPARGAAGDGPRLGRGRGGPSTGSPDLSDSTRSARGRGGSAVTPLSHLDAAIRPTLPPRNNTTDISPVVFRGGGARSGIEISERNNAPSRGNVVGRHCNLRTAGANEVEAGGSCSAANALVSPRRSRENVALTRAPPAPPEQISDGGKALVLYEFSPSQSTEMSVKKGDEVGVIRFVAYDSALFVFLFFFSFFFNLALWCRAGPEWTFCSLRTSEGYVPSSYLAAIPQSSINRNKWMSS